MAKSTPILTDDKVLQFADQGLCAHMRPDVHGYKVTGEMLCQVLLAVASQGMTVEQASQMLPGMPDATTVRKQLQTWLTVECLPEVEGQVNAALQAQIPQRVWRKPRDIAIDLHEQPYYGRTEQAKGLWIIGRPKASTKRFYRVATAYVMHDGLRVTLAIVFMPFGVTLLAGLQQLLAYLAGLQLPVRHLWLDRGFASVPVMAYLLDNHWPAVMPCPIRGKPDGHGLRALCKGRASYTTDHEFESRQHQKLTLPVAVCRIFTSTSARSHTPRRAEWQVFALIHVHLTPQQVRDRYSGRFGIETSYRCANQVRGWTTSPNPVYRFLLLGLAFYLYNVWVHLVWLYTQVPRRGGRYLDVTRFRLSRFKHLLLHAFEHRYGSVLSITAPAAPRL
jgi:hypothetical protein